MTSTELAEAIRKVNGDRTGNGLKAGEQLRVPGILTAPIVEKTIPVAKDFEVRAIYLTGIMAASDHGLRIIRHWREVGGNAVVFDIKDSDGSVTIPFEHPLLGKHQVYIHDVPKFVRFLHQQNMHAIARIAIFRDERLVKEHPELAVQSKRTKQPWRENGKLVWTDPSQPKVQEYDIALAKYVAGLGADEIQFDYVRFPAEGDQKDAGFFYQTQYPEVNDPQDSALAEVAPGKGCSVSPGSEAAPKGRKNSAHSLPRAGQGGASRGIGVEDDQSPEGRKNGCVPKHTAPRGPQRSDVITAFLKKAYAELHPTGVLLSLDVFGVMAWQRPVDLSHTGQDIVGMAKYCDVLSPMIYPSHFFGMDNIAHPGDAPEHFIGESMDRFMLIASGAPVKSKAAKPEATKSAGTTAESTIVLPGATSPDAGSSSNVVIRPWLQAFHWRTKTYSPEYIKVQVQTAKDRGGIGFLFWNAANDYSKPFTAMPEMRTADLKEGSKQKAKYFRGDELPGAAIKASLTPGASPAAVASGH